MAYYNQNQRNNNARPQQNRNASYNTRQPVEIVAEKLPKDYVDQAEHVIGQVAQERFKISTSKLRNLLSLISKVYNVENLRCEETILPESASQLTMMRIRVVYECGRDAATKTFVEKAHLLQYLKGLGDSREEVIRLFHYMEALVAYHRFIIGGKEG